MRLLKAKKAMVGKLIYYVIAVVIAVAIIPIAIITINQALGNFTTTQQTLLLLVPTLLVIGLVVGAISYIGFGGKN
jgi:hypothetical protein